MKRRFLMLGVIIVWLSIFFSSTDIILGLSGKKISKYINDIPQKCKSIYFGIDELSITDDLFSTVTFSGWAFNNKSNTSYTTDAKLILISPANKYGIPLQLSNRRDLIKVLPIQNIPKINQGLRGEFSPVGMADGSYLLSILINDAKSNCGFINTGRVLTKKGRIFSESIGGEKLAADQFGNMKVTNDIKFGIDNCELTNNLIHVSGWAIREGVDASLDTIYLEIKNPDSESSYYSTQKNPRYDLWQVFNNPQYYISGFSLFIPTTSNMSGEFQISIIINKTFHATTTYRCSPHASSIETNETAK